MSDPYTFVSQIKLFGCNFAPENWAWCQGQLIQIASNDALFSLLGTNYGGDGRTTFGLPDLRGRIPIGSGSGISQGWQAGLETVTLSAAQLPSHTHTATAHAATATGSLSGSPNCSATAKCNSESAGSTDPAGRVWGKYHGSDTTYAESVSGTDEMHSGLIDVTVDMGPVTVQVDTTVDSVSLTSSGGGYAHSNMSPFLVIPYSIALAGIFPSRN